MNAPVAAQPSTGIQYQANPAMFKASPFVFIFCLALVPVGIGIIILLAWYLQTKAEKFTITQDEIHYERGLLSKTRFEVGLDTIRTVRVDQSLFNRMFGVGKVSVFTAGDQPEIVVDGLPDPHLIRELT